MSDSDFDWLDAGEAGSDYNSSGGSGGGCAEACVVILLLSPIIIIILSIVLKVILSFFDIEFSLIGWLWETVMRLLMPNYGK